MRYTCSGCGTRFNWLRRPGKKYWYGKVLCHDCQHETGKAKAAAKALRRETAADRRADDLAVAKQDIEALKAMGRGVARFVSRRRRVA
jgi:hypothetical protein